MSPVGFWESLLAARMAVFIGIFHSMFAAVCAIAIGSFCGIVMGFIMTFARKYVVFPFRLFVDVVRGIPGLVVVFTIYYFLDVFLRSYGVKLPALMAGIIALSVTNTAQMAELTRGALQAIPRGQIEAGKAIGFRFGQILYYILLPQALIQMLPPWVNSATETVKGTTLLMLIGISDLLLVTQQLIATNNHALKYYCFIGLIYFLLNTVIEFTGKAAEKRLRFDGG
ncbi:MAG: amino acid ABC transporter permease [Synergistaceae bacterium]|jgi:polar amino acid transport system permease protein|nr:amino acid ABC transporter permease [Synergistaceae bacterium]